MNDKGGYIAARAAKNLLNEDSFAGYVYTVGRKSIHLL